MVSVSYLGLPLTFPFFFTSTQLSAAKRSESSEVSRNHVAKWKQGVGVTMEPTCEDGRHRGHEARTGEGRLEEMEMERRELKMKRVQGVKVNRFWTAEGENEDNVTERRGAWRREHKAGPEQPPAVWRCVDVTVFIRWEGRTPEESSLCSLHLSDERWDRSYKMHASSELLIVLFISLSYRGDVSLKNHERSWFRCRVHQNVPVTACWTIWKLALQEINRVIPTIPSTCQQVNSHHIYCL